MPPPEQEPVAFSLNKDTLAWLSKADPILRDRILCMLEDEGKHRRERERSALEADIAATRRGQYCGLAIGLTSIVAGALTGIFGSGVAGATIGGIGVIGLVAASALGRSLSTRPARSRPEIPNTSSSAN